MKLGMLARSESRGLGNLLVEFHRHLQPERTLIVHPQHRIPPEDHRYPLDTPVTSWRNNGDLSFGIGEAGVKEWLDGLDVLYTAETFYDWNIVTWARELGVRTVCHVMPEYFRHAKPTNLPAADVWWNPTPWLHELLPPGSPIIPVPVALDHFPPVSTDVHDPVRWLHVQGSAAAMDRNGTQNFLRSLRWLGGRHHVTVRSQDKDLIRPPLADGVELELDMRHVDDYWDLYGDADALVFPRRYGGLTLPAQEAMAAGLALVMPNIEPQRSIWPIIEIPAEDAVVSLQAMCGSLPIRTINAGRIADVMNACAAEPEVLVSARQKARSWAEENSWENLLPTYVDALERACSA